MLMHRDSSGLFVDRLCARTTRLAVAQRWWRQLVLPVWRILVWSLTTVAFTSQVRAESVAPFPTSQGALTVGAAPSLREWSGLPITALRLRNESAPVDEPLQLSRVHLGQPFSADLAREAMSELLASGRFASATAELEPHQGGVLLRVLVRERRIISDVRIQGGVLDTAATLEAAGVEVGGEVTRPELQRMAARVWQLYERRGYPQAKVAGRWEDLPEAGRVDVIIQVQPGPPRIIAERRFILEGPVSAQLQPVLDSYEVSSGARADQKSLEDADLALTLQLRSRGWFRAHVQHRLQPLPVGTLLQVHVRPGPRVRVRFEGNRSIDRSELLELLEVNDGTQEHSPAELLERVREAYEERGFFDARVRFVELESPDGADADWLLQIREGQRLTIVGRQFPCLTGERRVQRVNEEIDAILTDGLMGGDVLVQPVDPARIDAVSGAQHALGRRARPLVLEPWKVYHPRLYDSALEHIRDLYRSEGYLSVSVGPLTLLRRQCHPNSMPGRCIPIGERQAPAPTCPTAYQPMPVPDAASSVRQSCRTDPRQGVYCEPEAIVSIPIKLGPQTVLWDVEFRGNSLLVDPVLLEAARLKLGAPVSQLGLQQAARRILDRYHADGFVFASVDVDLELSQDRTRGRARFVIGEREPVTIAGFAVRGAERTSKSLILGRLELEVGGRYRRDLVRQSEEQLATLGVFASVKIELEDPEVPAREKVVVISVQERPSQYIDIKPGFSTGEGVRFAFEYGHRNLFGRALHLRLRLQVGYLPNFLILETPVRRNFQALSFEQRLERRNSVTLEVPLATTYRLAVDGVDVRDNARDYGLTKRAAILTLSNRLTHAVSLVTGVSFEDNDADVFGDSTTLEEYLRENPHLVRLLNVPEGRSFAIAFRAGASWDRTDNPLGATRGTFVSAEAEPVIAYLGENSHAIDLQTCERGEGADCEFKSRFVKVSNRLAGYIPFNARGLSLALSLRWGANFQLLDNSVTYPDRLFFFGGGDSLRGHLQQSVIPEDVARTLVPESDGPASGLTARDVAIRGGDFMLNPRVELRVPLTGTLQTALFLDMGNVWRELQNVEPWKLRYSIGSGIRFVTPIGPLAFDYGFKLDRRFYEPDLGAFHFSVGLF